MKSKYIIFGLLILVAISAAAGGLYYRNVILKHDKGFMLTPVKKDGAALMDASDELQNDKDVVLAAVKQDGYTSKYASR